MQASSNRGTKADSSGPRLSTSIRSRNVRSEHWVDSSASVWLELFVMELCVELVSSTEFSVP